MPKLWWNRGRAWRPRHSVLPLALFTAAAVPLAGIVAPAPCFAAIPVKGLIVRNISAAPSGADAVRVSIYGDKSGAKVQIYLLVQGEDGVLTGAFAPAPVTIDFEGWKTVTLPLSDFRFFADTNPDATEDGFGSKEGLATQAAAVGIGVTATNSRLFFADLGWAKAGGGPTDPLVAPMDPMTDASIKEWKEIGDFDQLRSTSFGLNKNATFEKNGAPSIQVIVRSNALREREIHQAVIDARLKDRPTLPYFVYTRVAFDPISPESVPTLDEVKAGPAVSIFACPDELEPASLSVYTTKELKDATIKVGSFATATKVALPAGSVDVRVVRIGGGANAPQLLMKDDRQSLSGPSPAVRLTGDPQTDIPAGTSKQFWVTVKIGKNQRPGTYKGNLVFSAAGVKPTTIPFSVEVLDMPMRSAFLQYGMDFRSLLSAAPGVPGGQVVTPDVFSTQLVDIRDHGFKNLMLYDKPEGLQTAIKLYKQAEMNPLGPLVVASITESGDAASVEALRTASGYRNEQLAIFYRLPEGSPKSFVDGVRAANKNARFVAPILSSALFKSMSGTISDDAGEQLAPIYPVAADYSQQLLKDGRRPITIRNVDYWTWNVPLQSPARNRLFAGFLLYSTGRSGSGVYGAFAGPYQYLPEGADPYAAFAAGADPLADPKTLPQMSAFPVQGGVLDTLQWEAVREGIDDIRYIGIMKGLIRDLKDLKVSKDITDAAESYLIGLASKPLVTQTPEQMQANRRGIVREAMKMQAILNPSRPAPAPRVAPKPAPKKKG